MFILSALYYNEQHRIFNYCSSINVHLVSIWSDRSCNSRSCYLHSVNITVSPIAISLADYDIYIFNYCVLTTVYKGRISQLRLKYLRSNFKSHANKSDTNVLQCHIEQNPTLCNVKERFSFKTLVRMVECHCLKENCSKNWNSLQYLFKHSFQICARPVNMRNIGVIIKHLPTSW